MIDNLKHRQQGLTIVELMIAMAIGLLIGLVVFAAYMSGIGTQRAQTDITRLEESARFSFDLLSRSIRRAGFRNTKATPISAKEFCATDTATAGGPAIEAINDPDTAVDFATGANVNVLNKSDAITVRYYGEDSPTAAGTADGAVLDCLGNAVSRGGGKPDGMPVQDRIFLAADAANNNEPTLFCSTDNPAAANNTLALIPGVESMQLLYAEDTDNDGLANRYVQMDKINKKAGLTNWDTVLGVLVSLVVRTPNPTGSDRSAKTFNHFDANYDATAAGDAAGGTFTGAADGRTRLQFSNFIALRNFAACP